MLHSYNAPAFMLFMHAYFFFVLFLMQAFFFKIQHNAIKIVTRQFGYLINILEDTAWQENLDKMSAAQKKELNKRE